MGQGSGTSVKNVSPLVQVSRPQRGDFISSEVDPAFDTHPAPGGQEYLPTLDGWRAISIMGVLLSHTVDAPWAGRGALGVQIFFGISGLLICTRLLRERERTGRISLSRFYLRRAFRILPPYLTYLLVLTSLGATGWVFLGRLELLSCLLFFRNYLPTSAENWYSGHFWSLAVEEHFYLLWPALLCVWGPRRALLGTLVLSAVVVLWRLSEQGFHVSERLLGIPFSTTHTDVCLDGLFLGCAMALWLDRPGTRAWFARVLTTPVWLLLCTLFVANSFIRIPLSGLRFSVLIPLILAGTMLRPHGVPGRLLELGPVRWLGRLSYSLYIWHLLFLPPAGGDRSPVLGMQATPWLGLALGLFAATLSYNLIERPMIRLGQRLTLHRQMSVSDG